MIGLNGGLLGTQRTTTTSAGGGVWTANEQVLLRRSNTWPRTDDPYGANVSLLLHMDGSNGGTAFTDSSSSPSTLTANGNAQISTAQSKFGGASGLFDGTGDYVVIPSNSKFDFGSSDMTIEFWFRSTQSTSNADLLGREWGGTNVGGWVIQLNGNGSGPLTVYWADYSTSNVFLQGSGSGHRDGNWHHLAWTKNGTVHTLWLDGASISSATTSTSWSTTAVSHTSRCPVAATGRSIMRHRPGTRNADCSSSPPCPTSRSASCT